MTGFKSVLVGLVLALLIIGVGHFYFHIPEGWGRGGLVLAALVVFLVFAFGPGRLWSKGGTLNSFALPLLLMCDCELPPWAQILGFVLVCAFLIARTISAAPRISRPHTPPVVRSHWSARRSN